ncbi:MAG: hypothetical protein U9Q30_00260 [Campylobacterota bacterium]|nr:hypothetical protein [Campylobacterota bacterium]
MIDKKPILLVLLSIIVVLLFLTPKIWLRNNIYYISKDINKLQSHYISLKEEKKFLKQQHEDALFKNQIMDSLILQNLEHQDKVK